MKRIRLDIGALTASPEDGGSFMFFLYRNGMDKCLPISLTPPEMHTVLAYFKPLSTDYISIQTVFYKVLQQYRVELLEVMIIKKEKKKEEDQEKKESDFLAELLFFDGEKELRQEAGLIDGIILAKNFSCPIYIAEDLMAQYAQNIDSYPMGMIDNDSSIRRFREALHKAINEEDYEQAAQISKKIDELKKRK